MSERLEAHPRTSYVGSRVRLIKGDLFVTGRARYVADINLPGTLHLGILRSPHAHARIRGIDISAAVRAAGVVKVLTGQESRQCLDPIPQFIDPAIYGGKHTDVHCLAVDKVLYQGHPVAAVVASSKHEVRAALSLIQVDYEPLPAVANAEVGLQPDAPKLIDQWGDNVLFRFGFTGGDVEQAFRTADHVIKDTIKIHRYSTQPIETRAYVAVYNQFDETLTLYATAQNPHPLRNVLSSALRTPENRIRVIVPNLGGAFGLKMHGHPEEPLVCLLAKLTGRPVKWVEDREECLLIGGREQIHHFEVAFNNDGRIVGLKDNLVGDVGAPASTPGWGMVFLTALTMPCGYRIEDMDVQFAAVVTNKGPWNASRGYGKEATNLVMERIMDMVAGCLGMDPAEVRYKNFVPPDAFPYKTVTGLVLDSGDYHATLKHALELIGYQQLREEQRRLRLQGRYIGIGMAYELTPEGGALPGTLVAGYDTSTVKVDPGGKITVLTGVTNPGGGNDTGIAQVVADELGVDISEIRVVQGDTDACPYGFGNYSGRSMIVGGGSAALAARDVREKMAKVAGVLLGEDPRNLVFNQSRIYSKDSPDTSLRFGEAAFAIYTRAYDVASIVEPPLEATRTYKPSHINHTPDEKGRINPYPSYSNGAYIAVVEVDLETGRVKVLKFAVVHDCGVIVNPLLVEGQIQGAVAMGIGAALGEELVYGEDGQRFTTSFKEYLMPRAADIPPIEISHHCSPSPYTLLGNKGGGEAGVGGSKAAVVNAVADALAPFGVAIRDLPLKPPTVWRLIQEAGVAS
ncbi:MAG: xanthine dehydrogenase family protein [Acidobacteria bacterium]|nr:xanthine dehydrogenase family protein [Acidobacteriota bacterium]